MIPRSVVALLGALALLGSTAAFAEEVLPIEQAGSATPDPSAAEEEPTPPPVPPESQVATEARETTEGPAAEMPTPDPQLSAEPVKEAPTAVPAPEPKLAEEPPKAPSEGEADSWREPRVVTGVVVEKSSDHLLVRDAQGGEFHLTLTEYTRYVWGESSRFSDFQLGATVRASYLVHPQDLRALEVWVLGPPPGGRISAR